MKGTGGHRALTTLKLQVLKKPTPVAFISGPLEVETDCFDQVSTSIVHHVTTGNEIKTSLYSWTLVNPKTKNHYQHPWPLRHNDMWSQEIYRRGLIISVARLCTNALHATVGGLSQRARYTHFGLCNYDRESPSSSQPSFRSGSFQLPTVIM